MIFAKPGMHTNADGKPQQLQVRHPLTLRLIAPEGEEVDESDLHIARLLRDKDLVPAERDLPAPRPKR